MRPEVERELSELLAERPSLRRLLRAALKDFPQPEYEPLIKAYVLELAQQLSEPSPSSTEDAPASGPAASPRAGADDLVFGADPLTLLYKLDAYLESVLIGGLATRMASR